MCVGRDQSCHVIKTRCSLKYAGKKIEALTGKPKDKEPRRDCRMPVVGERFDSFSPLQIPVSEGLPPN